MKKKLEKILAIGIYLAGGYVNGRLYELGRAHEKKRQIDKIVDHAKQGIKEAMEDAFNRIKPQPSSWQPTGNGYFKWEAPKIHTEEDNPRRNNPQT